MFFTFVHSSCTWAWLLLVVAFVDVVYANTEITNIVATAADDVNLSQSSTWPTFSAGSASFLWRVNPASLDTPLYNVCDSLQESPCEHEVWAVLDLDSSGWESFHKFTLRISWPAFYPTDFFMEVFSPREALAVLGQAHPDRELSQPPSAPARSTRRKYVRIRLVDTGVRAPHKRNMTVEATPFMITLEPLYFTVLPSSVIPTLLFLLPVVLVASLYVVPRTHSYLQGIAEDIRPESGMTSSQKQE